MGKFFSMIRLKRSINFIMDYLHHTMSKKHTPWFNFLKLKLPPSNSATKPVTFSFPIIVSKVIISIIFG